MTYQNKSTDDFYTYNDQGKSDIAPKNLGTDNVREWPISLEEYTNATQVHNEDNPDNLRHHLFVFEYDTNMVVWHVSDVVGVRDSSPYIVRTQDNAHVFVQASHFWTFKDATDFMDETVELYENIGEMTEITFL